MARRRSGRSFPCPNCPKTFSRTEYVQRHQALAHLGIRSWKCDCGAAYARSDLLTRHRRKCKETSNPSAGLEQPLSTVSFDGTSLRQGCSRGGASATQPAVHEQAALLATTASALDIPKSSLSAGERRQGDCISDGSEPSNMSPPAVHAIAQGDGGSPSALDGVMPWIRPDFLRTDEHPTSPFYIAPASFVPAYMCQESIGHVLPSVGVLSKWVREATEAFVPFIPIIHVPTFRACALPLHLSYSMAVAGAACEDSDRARCFAYCSLLTKEDGMQRQFDCHQLDLMSKFRVLQSILLYQWVNAFSRNEEQRQKASRLVNRLVANFRKLPLRAAVAEAPDYISAVYSGKLAVEEAWQSWITIETMKRTAFLVLSAVDQSKEAPSLLLDEIDMPLPCHEAIWSAPSAIRWFQAMTERPGPLPTLSTAIILVSIAARSNGSSPSCVKDLGRFARTVLGAGISLTKRSPDEMRVQSPARPLPTGVVWLKNP